LIIPPESAPPLQPGSVPLASGGDADVYALTDGLVLRRYRDAAKDVTREAAVMRHVRRHGFPAPRVHHAAGPDLVLDRVPGPTLTDALLAGDLTPEAGGQLLADLLRRLHALPSLGASTPGDRVVHLDLHPFNVILGPDGPVLIDWCNARDGRPALDVALSALILAQVAVRPPDASLVPSIDAMLGALLAATPPFDEAALADAVAYRLADPNMAAERDAVAEAAARLRTTVAP
jgi:aminoglycoside phosphotransferase (APT) family kinase protein